MKKFIGQKRIITELSYLYPEISGGKNISILLRAPSGYGKTTLAKIICYNILGEKYPKGCEISIPDSDGFANYSDDVRIKIMDEFHLAKNQEEFYPLIDEKKYIFIFCTNEAGKLKEPLVNRCINFVFEGYTAEEMKLIIQQNLNFEATDKILDFILFNSGHNPRVAEKLCERLNYVIKNMEVSIEKVKEIFRDIFGFIDGLSPEEFRYLKILESSGSLSLNNLSTILHIPVDTITREIEPKLIEKNLIKISSKGRSLK